MALATVTPSDIRGQTLDALGVPSGADERDAVAAALRRAAGSLCPCPPRTLSEAVASCLRGLVDTELQEADPREVLDRLLVVGDLLELVAEDEDSGGPRRRMIYAAPPAFCSYRPGHIIVIGLAPEQPSTLPSGVQDAVTTANLVRRVEDPTGDHAAALRAAGFVEIPEEVWLWSPGVEGAARYLERFNLALSAAGEVTSEPDVEVLDPSQPVTYYRGRWSPLSRKHSGRFVARRPRRYGADTWSYVDVDNGEVTRLLDLPFFEKGIPTDVRPYCRACDQAWQLQAAIDAVRGEPQRVRVHPPEDGATVVDLFAPPPAWLDRRWSVFGQRHDRSPGALFSWAFPSSDADREVAFASGRLWLSTTPADV